jgi:CRP/FNR family transcriptional regulator, cyclic AMP receptor protein
VSAIDLTHVLRTNLLSLPEVSNLSSLRRFTSLYTQGQPADALFFIESGLVKITRTNAFGERIILVIAGPGDLIGDEVMSSAETSYQADAEVLSPANIHRIPGDTMRRFLSQGGDLSGLLIDRLLQNTKRLAQKVELLCLNDVEFRIRFYLADLAEIVGPSPQDGYNLPITQAELADLIGATRETTSTTLNQLERKGLVKLSRRLLTVESPQTLRPALKAESARQSAT